MKLTLVLILVVACSWCSEAQDGVARHYCGRHLSNVLAALCWSSEEVKRDAGWLMPVGSARALGGGRGKRQGLADECCYKPCTIDELLTYC